MKIGIVMGSIRDGRIGEDVAEWVKSVAESYTDNATFEVVDLKYFPLPLFLSCKVKCTTSNMIDCYL